MPEIVLHQPILGKNRGETAQVTESEATFYTSLGYASYPNQDAPAAVGGEDVDLTNPANREKADEAPPSSPDVEPAELQGAGHNDAHREAQAQAAEESEAVVEKSAEVREEVEDGSFDAQRDSQAEADEASEESAAKGDNALNEPGDPTPVVEPAAPAIPAVDPGILDSVDQDEPATKGKRASKRP